MSVRGHTTIGRRVPAAAVVVPDAGIPLSVAHGAVGPVHPAR